MVMKKDRRKHDIKSKLVAAICMLLVSSIMMVSSTYAWFTLSTAPEVTGITTAIGANGNLEMALLPGMKDATTAYATVEEALDAIGNASGTLSTVESNVTWGNQVDLSPADYGLSKITLYPSKLVPTATGTIPTNYLGTPKYGADGRFTELGSGAFAAIHNNGAFGTTGFGVRAIGTSSGMSALELAYREALSNANNALQTAIAQAKSATSTGGSKLASLAVGKASAEGTYVVAAADKQALSDTYGAILTAIGYMETALKNYIIADVLTESDLEDTTYGTILTALEAATLEELAQRSDLNTTLAGYVTTLSALKKGVQDHKTALDSLTATGSVNVPAVEDDDGNVVEEAYTYDTYDWSGDNGVSAHVTALADIDKMLLNGKTISHYMANNFANAGELVSQMSNLVLEINATEGSADDGIFAQMADFVDDFTTPATITGVEYKGISADNLGVTMKVYASADPAYLPNAKNVANTFTANSNPFGEGGGSSLSDFYGYIVDMAFRTNAAGSYLQLQTEAVDRIYSDNEQNEYTMGHGSSMTFTVPAGADFPSAKMINLMSYIRVVFFNPVDNSIFGYARLDSTTAVVEQNTAGSDADGYEVTMQLKMWDVNANPDENGENPVGGWASSSTITALEQNVAKAVSSMVYLDGETLTNADVANVEFTGEMNIQFSSSAELKPMEYGDLRNGNTEGTTAPSTPTVDVTVTPTVTTNGTDTVSNAVSDVVASGTVAGFDLTDTNYTVASVTVDGTPVTLSNTDSYYFWTITEDSLTEDSEIVITLTAVTP